MNIGLSSPIRGTLSALDGIAGALAAAQQHLATGKRVNGPSDDPFVYFTANALTTRASTLSGLSDGIVMAQKTLTAANAGISAIQDLLATAQNLANQALAVSTSGAKVTGTNSTALTTASQIATTSGSASRLKAGDTITVSDGSTTATYTAANGDTVQTFLNAVNNTSGIKIAASLSTNGQIQLQANQGTSVTIGGSVTSPATLNAVTGLTAGTTSYTTSTSRQSLASQFDAIRTQVDQAVQDASYNGVNLLNGGTLSVVFNESGASKLSVSGVQSNSSSIGVAASTNQWQTDTDVNTAISAITSALATLQSQSATLGANSSVLQARQTFNKGLIDALGAGADDLTAANLNEESATILALQTRQQMATTSLAILQGGDQALLRLLA